jgi:hypothetical protein
MRVSTVRASACLVLCAAGLGARVEAQAPPFLAFDFEDGDLSSFFVPTGIAYAPCNRNLPVIPSGTAVVEDGEVHLTNSDQLGLNLFVLRPDRVPEAFPASRDYRVRLRVRFGTASQISILVKARVGLDFGAAQVQSVFERAYALSLFPEGADATYLDGALVLAETTRCHSLIEHREWPGAEAFGFAALDAGGRSIAREEWYWMEAIVQGPEDGGPVGIAARVWPENDRRPELPRLVALDPNGLALDANTRDAVREVQFAVAVSLDYPSPLAPSREPGGTVAIDDLAFSALGGCAEAPALVEREISGEPTSVEGEPGVFFAPDGARDLAVTLHVSRRRGQGDCPAAGRVDIVEYPPEGWEIRSVEDGGRVDGPRIVWSLDLSAQEQAPLRYTAFPAGLAMGRFHGWVIEAESDRLHAVGGAQIALSPALLPAVSDFGSIQHWLVLGPFIQTGAGAPAIEVLTRDYLSDDVLTESSVRPRAGDTLAPDFGGAAASTGLSPNARGRNPGGVPAWIEWRDLDDADDRIDFESIYGPLDGVVAYAGAYLEAARDLTMNLGVSSDDAIQLYLDGRSIHAVSRVRDGLARRYLDTPATYPALLEIPLAAGRHFLLVKAFEGQGAHNFRVGFVNQSGQPLAGAPDGLTVTLDAGESPLPQFRRGDANDDGAVNIADAAFVLNFLFLGGPTPVCLDAADANDDGGANIADGSFILNFLFLGGPDPPAPGTQCGPDASDDALEACASVRCPGA